MAGHRKFADVRAERARDPRYREEVDAIKRVMDEALTLAQLRRQAGVTQVQLADNFTSRRAACRESSISQTWCCQRSVAMWKVSGVVSRYARSLGTSHCPSLRCPNPTPRNRSVSDASILVDGGSPRERQTMRRPVCRQVLGSSRPYPAGPSLPPAPARPALVRRRGATAGLERAA